MEIPDRRKSRWKRLTMPDNAAKCPDGAGRKPLTRKNRPGTINRGRGALIFSEEPLPSASADQSRLPAFESPTLSPPFRLGDKRVFPVTPDWYLIFLAARITANNADFPFRCFTRSPRNWFFPCRVCERASFQFMDEKFLRFACEMIGQGDLPWNRLSGCWRVQGSLLGVSSV